MRLRITFIIAAAVVGGAERQLLMLLGGLDRTRFEPSLLAYEGGMWEGRFRELGIPFSIIPYSKGKLAALVATARWLRQWRPDIVHTYGHSANYVGRAAAILSGVKVVVAGERSAVFFKKKAHRAMDKLLAWKTDGLIANSSHAVRYYVDNRLFPAERAFVVRNGFDASALVPGERSLTELPRRIAYVGDFRKEKNHAVLLDAFAILAREFEDLELHLAGDGRLRADLENQAMRAGVKERVRFPGFIDDVVGLLHRSSIYVHPSLYEGMPNAVMEAMAMKLPCVVADNAGCLELIEHGRNGLVFDRTNAVALADSIRSLLLAPELAARFGAAARQRILDDLSVARMVERTCAIYEDLHRKATA